MNKAQLKKFRALLERKRDELIKKHGYQAMDHHE